MFDHCAAVCWPVPVARRSSLVPRSRPPLTVCSVSGRPLTGRSASVWWVPGGNPDMVADVPTDHVFADDPMFREQSRELLS